ncbi:MAG: hypothetical protein HY901_09875 [Deltaproteobacteria bacterium]|nr:hypothetical protein [Deltaproteobacteria bacterium]
MTVYFIVIDSVEVSGTMAEVVIGVDLAIPSQEHAGKLCCCTARDRYERAGGEWRFVWRKSETCS